MTELLLSKKRPLVTSQFFGVGVIRFDECGVYAVDAGDHVIFGGAELCLGDLLRRHVFKSVVLVSRPRAEYAL